MNIAFFNKYAVRNSRTVLYHTNRCQPNPKLPRLSFSMSISVQSVTCKKVGALEGGYTPTDVIIIVLPPQLNNWTRKKKSGLRIVQYQTVKWGKNRYFQLSVLRCRTKVRALEQKPPTINFKNWACGFWSSSPDLTNSWLCPVLWFWKLNKTS